MSFACLSNCARNVYSQYGEDGIVDAIFATIGIENRWCFECGASDGIFFSNTRRLLDSGWHGVLAESNDDRFLRLRTNTTRYGDRVHLINAQIDNVDAALRHTEAPPDLDLVVIDVDGQDVHLFNSMLNYRPRVVLLEFDPNADTHFLPERGGNGQAGGQATLDIASGRFYTAVAATWCNLILVAQPLEQQLIKA